MSRNVVMPVHRLVAPALATAGLTVTLLMTLCQKAEAAEESPREERLALLRERNIFDPNRQAPVREQERREVDALPPQHRFRLMGALMHDDKAFGFFDGSSSDYRRVLTVGDLIADFEVVRIDTTAVVLEHNGEPIRLPIGGGMSRSGDGDWMLADTAFVPEGPEERGPDRGNPDPNLAPAPRPGPGDEGNDVLRRMLERRRQEQSR